MSKDKEEAITVMMFLYNELWTKIETKQDIPSKPVSKLLRQIKKHINTLDEVFYQNCRDKIAQAKTMGLEEVVRVKKGRYIASREDILQSFYDALNNNPYQNLWVTEKTVMSAINSLREIKQNENDIEYINNSRTLIKSFIKHLGIKQDTKLSRLKYTVQQNLILEGKIA